MISTKYFSQLKNHNDTSPCLLLISDDSSVLLLHHDNALRNLNAVLTK